YLPLIVRFIERLGGLDHVLLTHRDDVGSSERYAERFGARTWIHEDDRTAAPWATNIISGYAISEPIEGVRIIPIPGHTIGSVAFLVDGEYLFTGDSLYWDHREQQLDAFPQYCWDDWPLQVASLRRLQDESFRWILAGHGGSIDLPRDRM